MKKIIYLLIINIFQIMASVNDADLRKLISYISASKAIILGVGAGLSTSAGLYLSGERFKKHIFLIFIKNMV